MGIIASLVPPLMTDLAAKVEAYVLDGSLYVF
jgi:hypothetical protein